MHMDRRHTESFYAMPSMMTKVDPFFQTMRLPNVQCLPSGAIDSCENVVSGLVLPLGVRRIEPICILGP